MKARQLCRVCFVLIRSIDTSDILSNISFESTKHSCVKRCFWLVYNVLLLNFLLAYLSNVSRLKRRHINVNDMSVPSGSSERPTEFCLNIRQCVFSETLISYLIVTSFSYISCLLYFRKNCLTSKSNSLCLCHKQFSVYHSCRNGRYF